MLPEKIMQSDLLDLLFENRNKLYGAYAIRKSYNKTLVSAITTTTCMALAFCLLQLLHHPKHAQTMVPVSITPDNELTKVEPLKPEPEKPAVKPPAPNQFKQIITSTPVIVDDTKETTVHDVDEIEKSLVGSIELEGDAVDKPVETPPVSTQGAGNGTAIEPVAEAREESKPLTWAQVMPEFPGGVEAFKKFMLRNLKHPENLNAGEKIIVTASFVVNKDGQIEQVKIKNAGRSDLDKEVMRVIAKMPLWKPGRQNGNAVAVYFNLPVTFMGEETE